MKWEPWSRNDPQGLSRYVTSEAKQWLALDVNRFDVGDQRRVIIEAIYNALVAKDIRYNLEDYHPAERLQHIRTPAEILDAPREGTCLDLAALFCGLCLGNELLPILIVVEGHALAAVSLTHGLRDWNGYRPERAWVETDPLTDPARLRQLIDSGAYLAIECTGFAHSERLGQITNNPPPESLERTNGVLSFERAVAAGREQLDWPARPFQFALDIAVAHNYWRIEPYPVDLATQAVLTNIYQIYSQAPVSVSTHIRTREFQTLVDERTRDFVGRDFIFKAIDDHLANKQNFPSGYIIIRGEPGIGKTALMGQLVKTRGYVHHFNIAPQNIRSTRDFLSNVCAQLIVRYELDHPTLPPKATDDSGFLSQLLTEAAEKAQSNPVVVLIDALDEADDVGLAPGVNRLYLPQALPAGVFFIVTTREEIIYRLSVDRPKDIHLRDGNPQNLDDVRQYIRNFIATNHDQMAPRIVAWGIDEAQFVEVITEKSQGNFMYLVYVLRDIHDGWLTNETVDDIQKLPLGLRKYYERHWQAMRAHNPDKFESLYEPIVCTLAAVREPVSVVQIIEWTKHLVNVELSPLRVRDVIQDWRQFLNEDKSERGEALFRIYHASFQDFLKEEVGLTSYHSNIAQTALDKIPGFNSRP
jgi:hypothetical protein